MTKEKFLPIDLIHIEESCEAIRACLEKYEDYDRSDGYRDHQYASAKNILSVVLRNIRNHLDKKDIWWMNPYGLWETK